MCRRGTPDKKGTLLEVLEVIEEIEGMKHIDVLED